MLSEILAAVSRVLSHFAYSKYIQGRVARVLSKSTMPHLTPDDKAGFLSVRKPTIPILKHVAMGASISAVETTFIPVSTLEEER